MTINFTTSISDKLWLETIVSAWQVRPKWPNNLVSQNIWWSATILEIYMDVSLFWNSSLLCNLSSMKNNLQVYYAIFYKIRTLWTQVIRQIRWLFFMKLKLHDKLEFQKCNRSLIISQTVIDHQIFQQKMVFYHFNLTSTTYTIFVFVKNFVTQPKPPNIFINNEIQVLNHFSPIIAAKFTNKRNLQYTTS